MRRLTPAQAERLALLAEECAEVVQAVTKILRHGYESYDPTKSNGPSNRRSLENEAGDVLFAIRLLVNSGEIETEHIDAAQVRKAEKWARYSHHQDPA